MCPRSAPDDAAGRGNCRDDRRCVCEDDRRGFIPVGVKGPRMLASNYKAPRVRPKGAGRPRLTKPGRNSMTPGPLRRAARDCGGVAERLKAADCKSADVRLRRFESYPLHQRFKMVPGIEGSTTGSGWRVECGCSSMVELQPSKLATWVRFP